MGSIEAFPRKRAANLADVWKTAPLRGSGVVKVRAARLEDYAAIRGLLRAAHPDVPPWTLKQFESRRAAFPEGQAVAECDGEVIGASGALVIHASGAALDGTWSDVTADGSFATHDLRGDTLYAAGTCVDSTRRGYGAARALREAQRKLCRRLNLRRIVATVALDGCAHGDASMSPQLYARRVIWGDIEDAALSFELAQGYQYCGILEDYFPARDGARGHAALMVWLNSMYSPARPPAFETARPRKCA